MATKAFARAGVAWLAAWAMAGSAFAADPAPVRMGFICPFTGTSAEFGTSARMGAELAVQEINEVGGLLGRPIQLVPRDDQGQPDRGRQVALELLDTEKVDVTVGFCNTGVALKAIDLFQQRRHLLVVPVATGTDLTLKTPPAASYLFRMAPSDATQVALLVEDIVRRGYSRVAVFADRTGYGEGGLRDVEAALSEHRLKPVSVGRFDLGAKSLAAPMQEAKAAGADAIVAYGLPPELALLAQARTDAKVAAPIYGPWTLSHRSTGELGGRAIEGAVMAQTILADISNERRASFIARLRRIAGAQPVGSLMAAAQTYDAVQMVMRAMFQAKGDLSGPALKKAMETLERPYHGVVTTYESPFSAQDHEAITRNMVWLGTWRGGAVRYFKTDDARKAGYVRRKDSTAWWD